MLNLDEQGQSLPEVTHAATDGEILDAYSTAVIGAQTRVTPPKNSYTPAQDVELGLQAAAQAEQQLPLMNDEVVTTYVQDIGRRLVTSIPAEAISRSWAQLMYGPPPSTKPEMIAKEATKPCCFRRGNASAYWSS